MRLDRRLAVLPAALALAAAGCGGSDGPTKKEFASKANQVCRDGQKKIEGLKQPKSPDDIPDYVDDLRSSIEGTANDLQGLDRPSGDDGKQAKKFVDAFEKDIKTQYSPRFEAMKKAAQSGNRQQLLAAYRKLQAVQTPESDKLAEDIGAPACSS